MSRTLPFLVGAVVIGRNEGQRLVTCLESLLSTVEHVVYVDSGSSDDSVELAKSMGVNIVELDISIPFTAARARNEGAKHLLSIMPDVDAIQFVDGDCEVQKGWIELASSFLMSNSEYAVVCGRRRERYPENSIYNSLCDLEWDTPIGDAMACGGDAMVRAKSYIDVDGYRQDLIAGEEPEMCFRLRAKQWKIRRLDSEMTLHDAAMTKFKQWWKRTERAGYAYALGSSIHGQSEERYWVRETQRIKFWGVFLPTIILLLSIIEPLCISFFMIYFLQITRVALKNKNIGRIRFIWAASVTFGKIPEGVGLIRMTLDRFFNKKMNIIEYK